MLAGVAVLAAATSAALHWKQLQAPAPASQGPRPQQAPSYPGGHDSPSNITPDSYVGPQVCGRCHKENYAAWLDHPHRRMNQLASDASVLGDFADYVKSETLSSALRSGAPASADVVERFKLDDEPACLAVSRS